MNKLSKIAIISSLLIIGGVISVSGIVLAQDDTNNQTQETPVEGRDRRAPMRNREDSSNQRQDSQRLSPQSQSANRETIESVPAQRITNQENRTSPQSTLTSEQREQKIKERCEAVGMRILNHQRNFTSKSQVRIAKYNKFTTRLEKVSNKLVERGVDVTTYNSYISELKNKITTMNVANQEYIQLFGTKVNTGEFCNNQTQLATEVDIRKSKLQSVIVKDREIRIYIKDTIIPYLRSIRPQETTSPEPATNPSGTIPQVIPQ